MGEDKKADTRNSPAGNRDGSNRKDEPAFEQGAKIKPQDDVTDDKPTPGHPV